jgi:hypothetical protein
MDWLRSGLAEAQKKATEAAEKARELAAQASVQARVLAEQATQQARVLADRAAEEVSAVNERLNQLAVTAGGPAVGARQLSSLPLPRQEGFFIS